MKWAAARSNGRPPQTQFPRLEESWSVMTLDRRMALRDVTTHEPCHRKPSRIGRVIRRIGTVALTGGTVAGMTTIWPVLVIPASMFLAGATLAVEVVTLVDNDAADD